MKKYGFIRVGNIVNNLKIGDPLFNREELVKLIKEAYLLLQGLYKIARFSSFESARKDLLYAALHP